MSDLFNLSRFNLLSDVEVSSRRIPFTFDGHPVTDYVPYANVLDVRIGSAGIENTTIIPGVGPGSLFVRNRPTTRIIEVDIELPLDKDNYSENAHLVRSWANGTEPKDITIKGYPSRYISGIASFVSEHSERDYWLPITVRFECHNPFFISRQAKTGATGTAIYIEGDSAPSLYLRYELGTSSKLTKPVWTFDGERQISLNTTITGGTVEIDFERKWISRNGESLMSYLTLTSRFPSFEPGSHLIAGPSGGIVTWYERWI